MLDYEKKAVLKVINGLWAHDAWNWGNTCAKLVNQEIDWDKPAIVEIDGEYITANVFVKDGREFQIGYQEGGWWMCFIKDCDDQRARLTKHRTGFPPNHRDEPFCECDVCMGFVSRANRPQVTQTVRRLLLNEKEKGK